MNMILVCAALFGTVTLNTEWQDVPSTTKVGEVLNLGNGPVVITNGAEAVVRSYDATNLTGRINAKYVKPSGGIPMEDLAPGVYNTIFAKQDTLVSGTNIKTINNQSLLGSGNIEIQGGGGGGLVNDVKTNGVSIVANKVADIYNPVRAIASSASVTNAGAVADAEAKYLPKTGGTVNGNLIFNGVWDFSCIVASNSAMGVTYRENLTDYIKSRRWIGYYDKYLLSDWRITNAYTKAECDDKFIEEEDDPVWNDEKANYLTTQTASTTYQPLISDLTDIRLGAGLGATAVQPAAITDMATKTWVGSNYKTTQTAVSGTGSTSKTLTAISQNANGVITPTFNDISITKSQVSDLTDGYIGQVATNAVANSDSLWSQTNTKLTNTIERQIANADTTYTAYSQITNVNQTIQSVTVASGASLTILAPTAPVKDWIVYANCGADDTPLILPAGQYYASDEAYTNALKSGVTALYFTTCGSGIVIGRQELKPISVQ